VAAPLATSFVAYILVFVGSVFAFRKARERLRQTRYLLAGACAATGVVAAALAFHYLQSESARADFVPTEGPNAPLGTARGVRAGRVVWVHDPSSTDWDGSTGYWWGAAHTSQTVVDDMTSKAVGWLTGAATDAEAWHALFLNFNRTNGKGDVGYQTGEKIAVKVNLNVSHTHTWTDGSNPSPQVVISLLRQLVNQAGVAGTCVSVYDASRVVGDPIYNPCHAEFPGVAFVDRDGGSGRVQAQPGSGTESLIWYGDPSVEQSGEARVPSCAAEADYMINLALLKGHQLAGVTLCAKNHFGSIWRDIDGWNGPWDPANMHAYVAAFDTTIDGGLTGRAMGTYNSLVDLMGHRHLGGKTVLFMVDGLYAAVSQSGVPGKWDSAPFNGDWTSSLFVSQDGVAIDSVGVNFAAAEPTLTQWVTGTLDNYLHEAAQAAAPPSGTFYDPEGDGTRLASLGAHEHWNNATDKQYSRNLGTGDGIEQVSSAPGSGSPPQIVTAAAADPDTVTLPATTTLSVAASDTDAGDVLSYTWSRVSGSGAVTFTPNATTASASSEAVFSAGGDYTLRVTVSDGSFSVSSDVDVVAQGGSSSSDGGCAPAGHVGRGPGRTLPWLLLLSCLALVRRRFFCNPRTAG
jgi:hypothetical protein